MKKFLKAGLFVLAIVCSFPTKAQTISCTSATDTQFVPSWGQVYVNKDTVGKYIYQWVYWHNDARLYWFRNQPFTPYTTFEPDAWFDGYGTGYPEPSHPTNVPPTGPGNSSTAYGYFLRNVSIGYAPDFGYWSSDLPTPYQDTAFGDTGQEWVATVGTSYAPAIVSGRVYYTVTRIFDGGANSGRVKLSAQRGLRSTPSDTSKWGSFGCSQAPNNVFTLPWNNFTAPGCRTWWYKWDISTNQAC